jgi:uncharacterized protein YqeY
MIVQKIKDLLLEARKSKDSQRVTFYSTLLGELVAIGKTAGNRDTTDDEAVRHIKKWVNNIDETMKARGGVCTDLLLEKKLCEEFLPSALTEPELRGIIKHAVINVGVNQGAVMKYLKDRYPNQYDGKLASAIFKELTND